jgi:hypothetical protein
LRRKQKLGEHRIRKHPGQHNRFRCWFANRWFVDFRLDNFRFDLQWFDDWWFIHHLRRYGLRWFYDHSS